MDLKIFLDKFDSYLQESRVMVFTPNTELTTRDGEYKYPLLFFSMLRNKIKEKSEQFITVDVMEHEPEQLSSQLSMSFLGLNARYWLRSFHELDAKKKKYWLSFIASYQGPHQIIFYSDAKDIEEADGRIVIEIPELADAQHYERLLTFFKPEIKTQQFSKSLFVDRSTTVPFDSACLMMEYHAVTGAGVDEFIKNWLNKMVPSEKSLFTLSQHFFAKSTKSFFSLWQDIGPEYPEMFWTTYWSEQLWRAHYFVKMCKNKDLVQAKKIAYRLPFSFIQRDWRKLTQEELQSAHQAFYDFDFNFKNGASADAMELIFHKFLLGEFKSGKIRNCYLVHR
jgi:hypothetical protein